MVEKIYIYIIGTIMKIIFLSLSMEINTYLFMDVIIILIMIENSIKR